MKPQRAQRNTLSSPAGGSTFRRETPKEYLYKEITEKIISCAIEVHSILGPGLLENLYEEALEHELSHVVLHI